MRINFYTLLFVVSLQFSLFCSWPVTGHAALILGYQFNDEPNSVTAAAIGSAAASAPALNIISPAFIGADGSGITGLAGDRALNNRAATSMGGTTNSSGGRGTHAADFDAIDGLLKFTITGSFKTDSTAKIGGNALLVANRSGIAGFSLFGDPNVSGSLVLAVDGGSNSSSGFGATQEWVNFAVTYDGTGLQPGPNVFFYAGGINVPLVLVGSGTNTNGSGNDPVSNETAPLSIGSRVLFGTIDADPFDGFLDEIRIYDEVLPLEFLNGGPSVMAPVPEPSTFILTLIGGVVLSATRRFKRST